MTPTLPALTDENIADHIRAARATPPSAYHAEQLYELADLLAALAVERATHRSSPSSAWRGMAEMKVADRTRGTFWLAGGDAKELAYFSVGWGNWLNAYTDKQIRFEPTHYLRNDLPPLPEPPK